MRGKHRLVERDDRAQRYNPACAEKTLALRGSTDARAIQPRVCGENFSSFAIARETLDTTPRVRGKLFSTTTKGASSRYNPACAGKTRVQGCHRQPDAIQPRVCGENAASVRGTLVRFDTTPRVRGKPEGNLGVGRRVRYNPACAGKTSSARLASVRTTIQPRVCGENASERSTVIVRVDTTPRVRGKQ